MRIHWKEIGLCLLLVRAGFAVTPAFSLPDSNGRVHTSSEWAAKRAIVLLFLSTDCPLSNNLVPELNRLNSAYAPRGIAFYAIQGDATVTLDQVRAHVKDFGYTFPYLLDARESWATYTGAVSTPEAAVLSPRGDLLYLGRVDNRVEDYGQSRTTITEFDLRDALEAVLNGRPVPHPRTKALGCAIVRNP